MNSTMRPDRRVLALAAIVVTCVLAPAAAHAAATISATGLQSLLAALVLILLGASSVARCSSGSANRPCSASSGRDRDRNLGLLGIHGFETVKDLEGIEILAEIGVLFLLFQVGLETDVQKVRAVGRSALLVALLASSCRWCSDFWSRASSFPTIIR